MTNVKSEQIFFFFSDFKKLFKKNKNAYLNAFIISFVLLTFFLAIFKPTFIAESKLRKASQLNETSAHLKNFLSVLPISNAQSNAAATFKSRDLLSKVISDLGMQVRVSQKGFISTMFTNAFVNIKAEFLLKHTQDEIFQFQNVVFKEDFVRKFLLEQCSDSSFILTDVKTKRQVIGKIGQQLKIDGVSFTIAKAPPFSGKAKKFTLNFLPLQDVIKEVKNNFFVKYDKLEKDVLLLSFASRNQKLACSFLDSIMNIYMNFVKGENAKICEEQSEFLAGRRKEVEAKFLQFLDEHAEYLEKNLEQDGFLGLYQQMALLEKPNEEYNTKLYDICLDISRINKKKSDDEIDDENKKELKKIKLKKDKSLEFFSSAEQLEEKIVRYLSTKSKDLEKLHSQILLSADAFLQNDLERIRLLKQDVQILLSCLENEGQISNVHLINKSNKGCLSKVLKEIIDHQNLITSTTNENIDHLKQELKEKKANLMQILKEISTVINKRQEHIVRLEEDDLISPSRIVGLTPATMQNLFVQYNNDLDAVNLNMQQLIFVRDQIFNPEIEISSLCNLLTDPISQQMIHKAGQMALELRDDDNRSSRETERIRDSLSNQKKFLFNHITQMISAQKLKANVIHDKLDSLQSSTLDILNAEKQIIEEKLKELKKNMSFSLPKKWKSENELMLKKEIFSGVLETLAKMEESKIIDKNMQFSDYRIIEYPIIPKTPSAQGIFFIPALLSGLLCICKYFWDFIKRMSKGSPVSFELIEHLGLGTAVKLKDFKGEELKDLSDDDLESLRKVAFFAQNQKPYSQGLVLALLGNKVLNYADNLSEILALRGFKVLLIDSSRALSQNGSGLLSFLKDEIDFPCINKRPLFDCICSGGYSRNIVELLSRNKFKKFILDRKNEYDFVLIHSQSKASSMESMIFQSCADACVISSGFDDSLEDLREFINWKKFKKEDCLAFVFGEE